VAVPDHGFGAMVKHAPNRAKRSFAAAARAVPFSIT
jgi:hypothetical protein